MFKKRDPDVVDSAIELDYTRPLTFPALSPESRAIALVKGAFLTIPGVCRSAASVQDSIEIVKHTMELLMTEAGKTESWEEKEWTATPSGQGVYTVTFHFLTNGEPQEAVWSANVATREVTYLNLWAKNFSCTPKSMLPLR
jgi:hypothetical protein